MQLTRRDAVCISIIVFLLATTILELDRVSHLEAEVEDLKQCGRLLMTTIRDHPEVLQAIANETKNFTFYGCVHWANWFAGKLAEEYNISVNDALDLIWATGYFVGKITDHPSYHEPGPSDLLPDLVGALLIALPVAVLAYLVVTEASAGRGKHEDQH